MEFQSGDHTANNSQIGSTARSVQLDEVLLYYTTHCLNSNFNHFFRGTPQLPCSVIK